MNLSSSAESSWESPLSLFYKRQKIIFAHFSFSQVAVPVGLSSVCYLKRGTGNETEMGSGLWDAAGRTLSAEVIYTLCSDNWCVGSFQLSTESSANVCMAASLDERRSQIACYNIWTLFTFPGLSEDKSHHIWGNFYSGKWKLQQIILCSLLLQ